MKLAVISCFYSFSGYKRPVQNLHRFLRQMAREGVAVFGAEAHLPNRPPHTKSRSNWQHIRVDRNSQVLWHKEALLNLAEKQVPDEYDAIAWVDADLWFSNPNWVADTESALENADVVQLFEKAYWTSETGTVELTKPCVPLARLTPNWRSHPGFAWAMRREHWHKLGGLYPFALSGGGDSVMSLAFQGDPLWARLRDHLGTNPTPYAEWAERARGTRLGYTPGGCYHEWHGTRKDRNYVGRAKAVAQISVGHDLILGPNGLPMWTPNADPATVKSVADYFTQRNEDGNA
jgi:hypothetical protein